jgi:hypothetical protein
MEKIENITKEGLITSMVAFIKDWSMRIGERTNLNLPIEYSNWMCGMGLHKKWSHTEITLDDKSYIFKDKEITEEDFIHLLNKALEKSGVNGKVFYDVCGDGYWCEKQYIFRRLEIFAKPCKEFNELNKLFKKYASKTLGDLDVFSVEICGKRSSYSDCGEYHYLCHNAKKCLSIIEYIKANKGRNGVVSFSVNDYLDHGDETDYKIAQYQESEWYGKRGNNLTIVIKCGRNKKDYSNDFVI